jgi:Tat protein translocase TatB subunit
MPQLGPMEIVVIAALALIVFGPERLPDIARNIGKAVRQFRRMASDVKGEFDFSFDEDKPERKETPEARPKPETHSEAPPLARPPDGGQDPNRPVAGPGPSRPQASPGPSRPEAGPGPNRPEDGL